MKSLSVAVIGKSNAGKSTLVNVLVGEKVSIVSPKPQTTRDRILGILNEGETQIVFVDTPGLYRAHNKLSELMQVSATSSANEVDLILYLIDGHNGVSEYEIEGLKRFAGKGAELVLLFTKIDIMPKESMPVLLDQIKDVEGVSEVLFISSRAGKNVQKLKKLLFEKAKEGQWIFEDNVVSDKSEKFMIAEIMREKLLLLYDKEIPHGIAIGINEFYKKENGTYEINLDIICEKDNHKAIIIGRRGEALKNALSFARKDMEKFLDSKVFLTGYVKVIENWRNKEGVMRDYGYYRGII